MSNEINLSGNIGAFLGNKLNLLNDDLARNSNAIRSLLAKLPDVEEPSLKETLEQLGVREEILTKKISALSEEKLKLKQDIVKESASLVSSHRLILLTVLLTAIIISVSVFYAAQLIQAQANQILEEKTERLNVISTQLENDLLKFRSIIEASSSLPKVQDVSSANLIDKNLHGIPPDADPQKREMARDILRANKEVLAVFFALPNGDMYMNEPYYRQENLRDSNFAFRDWYEGVSQTQNTYISELFISQGSGERTIAVSTPVYSNSKYVGIWGAILNVDHFTSSLQNQLLEQNEQLVIIDKNKNIIYDSSNLDLSDERIIELNYMDTSNGLRFEKSINDVQIINDIKSLVLTAPIHTGNDHWMVILIQPYEDAFALSKLLNEPLFVTVLFIIIILLISIGVIVNMIKKSKQIQTNIGQLGKHDPSHNASDNLMQQVIIKKVDIDKKVYALIIIAVSLIGLNTYLSFMSQEPYLQVTQMKSGFVIENLRGDTVDTWTAWNVLPGRVLDVSFVNPDDISEDQLAAIKDVILSDKSISVDDSVTHKGPKGQESLYYDGWSGALKKASEQQSKFIIPTAFRIVDSSQGEGDIVFHFSTAKNVDGYTGYTNAVVDQNQILKSTITIYDVDELTPDQIGIIARHEFGHAMGLAHSSAPEDLMAPIIITPVPYISECDLSAVHSLYDGNEQSQVICEK